MSVKILQREGLVVPISGKICDNCKADYESNYATKPGEKIVIIMPKAQLPVTKPALAIPSPFATSPVPPQPTSGLDQTATKPSHPNLPSPKSPNLDMMKTLNLVPTAMAPVKASLTSKRNASSNKKELDSSPLSLPAHVTGHKPTEEDSQPIKRKRGRPKKIKEPDPKEIAATTLQGKLLCQIWQ